ncbi:unnamed protein product, partial [Adineta steineri]
MEYLAKLCSNRS